MARSFTKGKRKRFIALTAIALSVTLSLGVLSACGGNETTGGDEEETVTAPTDTQTIKNGNFEFYSEMTEDKLTERRDLINSPTSWTITTVSPSSDTKSGIIDTGAEAWKYLAKEGRNFTDINDAYTHWNDDNVTAYDRLKFLDRLNTAKSDEKPEGLKEEYEALDAASAQRDLLDDFRSGGSEVYSIDYEDVQDLNADFPDGISLHEEKAEDTNVLMLHCYENSDGVLGTAVYATSSTTITLKAGTAAKVSVWVRTDKLTHYYSSAENSSVEKDGGAYIAVTNTVGSNSSSPQFVIKNINTKGAWEQYTIYIRANIYATTTYRMVLGLGRSTSSDNRLEAVNGYAFFDDVVGETISADEEYETAVKDLPADVKSGLDSDSNDRMKDATKLAADKAAGSISYDRVFALDLLNEDFTALTLGDVPVTLTKETSSTHSVASKVGDNRDDDPAVTPDDRKSIAEKTTYAALKERTEAGKAGYNGYLKTIFANDFDGKFPFYEKGTKKVNENTDVVMLLSTNGAAYTATLENDEFSLGKKEYMLVSFFVKTSKIRTGKTGASVTLVDGENRTTIAAFDSTTVDTVDIDKDRKDIYSGWVQCFFIVKNETEDDGNKTFSLELNYGPTAIGDTKVSDYADGYAAFANFQFVHLNKTQADYASTGNYAKSVSLTESVKDSTKFDDVAYSYSEAIKNSLSAQPANFKRENFTADDTVYSGLLNADYKANYYGAKDSDEKLGALVKDISLAKNGTVTDGETWWDALFGDARRPARVATQPLIIYNSGTEAAAAHGYSLQNFSSTLSANSTQYISLRLKVSEGLHAFVYLYDLSEPKTGVTNKFAPTVPEVTFWYDDDGNILKGDPAAEEFNRKTDVLFYLQDNGLYQRAGETGSDKPFYANLWNFDTDDMGNLTTRGDNAQIVYFRNENDENDTNYYAYRTEDADGKYSYSRVVTCLPKEVQTDGTTVDITRYVLPSDDLLQYSSVIEVAGTENTADTWTEVAFYIRTGNEQKTYSLAVWAGAQGAQSAIPAGGYLFVDNYKNESTSNFDAIRDERVSTLSDDPENLVDAGDKKSNLKEAYALYYTYTFYDSDRYVRYDRTQDEDKIGSPWIDYAQSSNEEALAWLYYRKLDAEGESLCSEVFIDYSVSEVEVAEHVYDTGDDTTDTDDDTGDTGDSTTNVWLIISSAVLAVVLIFAIVAVIVRMILKRRGKGKIKVAKDKPAKKQKAPKKKEAPAETEEEQPDENDPYNE